MGSKFRPSREILILVLCRGNVSFVCTKEYISEIILSSTYVVHNITELFILILVLFLQRIQNEDVVEMQRISLLCLLQEQVSVCLCNFYTTVVSLDCYTMLLHN